VRTRQTLHRLCGAKASKSVATPVSSTPIIYQVIAAGRYRADVGDASVMILATLRRGAALRRREAWRRVQRLA
jgi:hypothetical protein